VTVNVSNDVDAFAGMDPDERAALEAAIEEGYADFEKGDFVDGIDFANSLAARK
jgi:predicted transcriptional regulator